MMVRLFRPGQLHAMKQLVREQTRRLFGSVGSGPTYSLDSEREMKSSYVTKPRIQRLQRARTLAQTLPHHYG
ncbi:MAG: hypothetical protein DLM52_05100 [Chthoniobacterales bacterium]|nr:MAG: hypothetical protein DLM52_05100 [Chthoniobacterales bacterium]